MSAKSIEKLKNVISSLTAPDGCPWDKEQTPQTLCDSLIEEAFELVEAIRADDKQEVMEELGDVMFLLLFIAQRYEEDNAFTFADAVDSGAAKMIRRHPHVFADCKVEDQEELLRNWEKIKRSEKKGDKKIFDSLPKGLPPMLKAYRINSKAARSGFTYESDEQCLGQLDSEWKEWNNALDSGNKEAIAEEFGDYLFTLIELGRRKGIKANTALDITNNKFLERFAKMEDLAKEQGKDISEMSLIEQNELWEQVKK
ncbi:nucleoside triphosphate pyrophosphohydrolase [Maridesulfovibrio salexigens]|uniref:MazG family protein n=1 Tax=Maridesulfovibrio salexigens (strain ATCC 14822 / DSM 2638 / NCIMB 8403 / VKM B-1763) TaxID=526222 RepID=C6C0H0_MARSD|nr:nucleoside triphosphate pyrophosphohydrolase [Maridesulfovibrio salexigens]ACS79104.1 MazG family protein [Maridesulfovibrio salexigens DSM 2638]